MLFWPKQRVSKTEPNENAQCGRAKISYEQSLVFFSGTVGRARERARKKHSTIPEKNERTARSLI